MSENLPARLDTADLMPPEDYLRPRSAGALAGFSVFTLSFAATIFLLVLLSSVLGVAAPLFAGALAIGAVALGGRRLMSSNEDNRRGIALLNAGEIDDAEAIFNKLAARHKRSSNHVIYVYNVGVASLLRGRHQRAYSIFNAIDHSGLMRGKRRFRNLEPNLYIEMGCCLALTGHVKEARAQLSRAEKRLEPPDDARLLFLQTLVDTRSANFEAAIERVDENYKRAEGMLRGPTLRTLRMLYGFAMARLGRKNSRRFELMVAGAMPATADDFRWATVAWPEFETFVQDNVAW